MSSSWLSSLFSFANAHEHAADTTSSSSTSSTQDTTNLSFDDLKEIERKRRKLLQRVKSFNVWKIVFAYQGTIFESIFYNWESWICVLIYIAIRLILQLEVKKAQELPVVDVRYLTIIGGFLSFMMVFYTNQTYSRLVSQYNNSMRIETKILNLVLQIRGNLSIEDAWRFVRYLNAIHLLGYTGLSETYTEKNFFDPMNEIHKFLTPSEVRRVKMIGADAEGGAGYRELLSWTLEILSEASRKGTLKDKLMGNLIKEIIQLHENIASLYDFEDQPIPFVYIHLIFFLCLFYLPLFAYSLAVTLPTNTGWVEVIGVIIVMLNTVFFLGLREVGHFLTDPYGSDLHDLSVMHYIESTMLQSRQILTGHSLPAQNMDIEAKLEKARPTKGKGFQDGCMAPVVFSESFSTLIRQPTMGFPVKKRGSNMKGFSGIESVLEGFEEEIVVDSDHEKGVTTDDFTTPDKDALQQQYSEKPEFSWQKKSLNSTTMSISFDMSDISASSFDNLV